MAIAEVKLQHCFALTQRCLAMETLPRLMLQFVLPVICQEDSLPQWIQLSQPRLNLKNHTHAKLLINFFNDFGPKTS